MKSNNICIYIRYYELNRDVIGNIFYMNERPD